LQLFGGQYKSNVALMLSKSGKTSTTTKHDLVVSLPSTEPAVSCSALSRQGYVGSGQLVRDLTKQEVFFVFCLQEFV
jgi:hypothetical protein